MRKIKLLAVGLALILSFAARSARANDGDDQAKAESGRFVLETSGKGHARGEETAVKGRVSEKNKVALARSSDSEGDAPALATQPPVPAQEKSGEVRKEGYAIAGSVIEGAAEGAVLVIVGGYLLTSALVATPYILGGAAIGAALDLGDTLLDLSGSKKSDSEKK